MFSHQNNYIVPEIPIPVDIVLAPVWWHKNTGMTFDKDFFFHPARRVEDEQKMEKVLFERWGSFGLGQYRHQIRPEVGAVHLAAGFFISEMLGCQVEYREDNPPLVIPAEQEDLYIDEAMAFQSAVFKTFIKLTDKLKTKYGHLTGDVNWGGILNIALDLRGQEIFIDMLEKAREVHTFFTGIANVIHEFVTGVQAQTGSSSISVNRNVFHLKKPVFLHSECSNTMISVDHFKEFLFTLDEKWSINQRPFGIHFCGDDPHRYATVFSELPHLDFLDVGWGGNIKSLREYLPDTFLNLRLSPVEIINQSVDEIEQIIRKLVTDSGDPWLTGVCCINMDHQVGDEKITAIFQTVEALRKEMEPNI
jgi:hypothetical protein